MDSIEHKLWMEQIGWLVTIAEEFKRFNDREEAKQIHVPDYSKPPYIGENT